MNDADQSLLYVKPEYPQSKITGRIIAAAQQVHRTLGSGFEEVIYQRALALELPGQGLDFVLEFGWPFIIVTEWSGASALIS